MNKGFSLWLDVLRVLATFVVVVSHFAYQRFSGGGLQWFRDLNFGSDAVVVFFVVSGLVIAFAAERDGTANKYAFNRLTRLWSVVIPAIVLTMVLDGAGSRLDPTAYPAGYYAPQSWLDMILRGGSFSNEFSSLGRLRLGTNGPLWSLSYEAAYYALFGVAMFMTGLRRIALLVALVVLVGLPILLLMPAWLMGVGAWHAIKTGQAAALSRTAAWALALAGPLGYAGLLALGAPDALLHASSQLLGGLNMNATFGFSDEFVWNAVLGMFTVLHILGMARLMQGVQTDSAAIRWFAGASFSLYVTHYPALHFFDALLPQMTGRALVLLVAAIISGLVFASLFERRIIGFRQTLRKAMTAFNPPKAKALDNATSTTASLATLGTTSSAHSGSGSS